MQLLVRTGLVPYWYSPPTGHQDIFSPSSWQENKEMPELPAGPHVAETNWHSKQRSREHRTDYTCTIDWIFLCFSICKQNNVGPFFRKMLKELVFLDISRWWGLVLLSSSCLSVTCCTTLHHATLHLASLPISPHCVPDFPFIRHKLCVTSRADHGSQGFRSHM